MPPPKLSEAQLKQIIALYYEGDSLRTIATLYNVSHITIWRIINGERTPTQEQPE